MKKLFGILLVVALLLPVFAGCQDSEAPATTPSVNTPETTAPAASVPATTAPAAQYITPEEAKAIALQDAELTEDQVRDLEVELDRDEGQVHYDVDFEKGSDDYDYDIDATTGEILLVKKPAVPTSATPAPSTPATTTPATTTGGAAKLTSAEAKEIALKHAGLKESDVRDLDVDLDRERGVLHYDVDFEKDGYDYEYEIDAASGEILSSRKERD